MEVVLREFAVMYFAASNEFWATSVPACVRVVLARYAKAFVRVVTFAGVMLLSAGSAYVMRVKALCDQVTPASATQALYRFVF